MKKWLPVILNVLILITSIYVQLTPTKTDDEIFQKVKDILPIVIAQTEAEQAQYSEENFSE